VVAGHRHCSNCGFEVGSLVGRRGETPALPQAPPLETPRQVEPSPEQPRLQTRLDLAEDLATASPVKATGRKKTRGRWWKYLLGCGCLCTLMTMVSLAGAMWFGCSEVSHAVSLDAAEVDRLAASIFPGAKPFDGYDGVFGMSAMGARLAIISSPHDDDEGALTIALIQLPNIVSTKAALQGELNKIKPKALPAGVDLNIDSEHADTQPVDITLGGKTFPAEKSVMQDDPKTNNKKTRYVAAFKQVHGTAILIVQGRGTGTDFNHKAMNEFLANLDPTALHPLFQAPKPHPASHSPAPDRS